MISLIALQENHSCLTALEEVNLQLLANTFCRVPLTLTFSGFGLPLAGRLERAHLDTLTGLRRDR
jgi:hypothetical protein